MSDLISRLRKARIDAGYKSAQAAADSLGINASTYRAHENGQNDISPNDVIKYANKFKVSEAWLLTGDGEKSDKIAKPVISAVHPMRVEGKVQAGAYLDISLFDDDHEKPLINVPRDERFRHAHQYALEVVGDSMDEVFPDGTYVTCVSWGDAGLQLKEGMYLHIERHEGHLVETTLKCFEIVGGVRKLVPKSKNKTHKAIELNGNEATEIVIKGLALGSFQSVFKL